jgi:hypothetical protein
VLPRNAENRVHSLDKRSKSIIFSAKKQKLKLSSAVLDNELDEPFEDYQGIGITAAPNRVTLPKISSTISLTDR